MDDLKDIQALDRNGDPLQVGDQVRFVMRGFFLPREQESFGSILEIDEMGGISIQMSSPYRHFLSTHQSADTSDQVYFTHHRYDPKQRARIYSIESEGHELFIEKIPAE